MLYLRVSIHPVRNSLYHFLGGQRIKYGIDVDHNILQGLLMVVDRVVKCIVLQLQLMDFLVYLFYV